jgi:polyisoprenoid-binding protein YceI
MSQWQLDPTHSRVEFAVKHMVVSTVRGNFNDVDATLDFDPANPAAASVNATIQVTSINTGTADRDNHLRSADFFDVETYPTITFKSTGVKLDGDRVAQVTGDLTLRDVTKPVTLDVEFLGEGLSPFGKKMAAFEASGKINREDFGLTWNVALEAGGVLVSKDVKLSFEVQFTPVEA